MKNMTNRTITATTRRTRRRRRRGVAPSSSPRGGSVMVTAAAVISRLLLLILVVGTTTQTIRAFSVTTRHRVRDVRYHDDSTTPSRRISPTRTRRRRQWQTRRDDDDESDHEDDDDDPKETDHAKRSTTASPPPTTMMMIPSRRSSKTKRRNDRMSLFAWLNRPSVEVVSALAVLLSVLLVALSTLEDVWDPLVETVLRDAKLALNAAFAVDFVLRWYAAGQFRFRYLTKPLVTIDVFVVILPLVLDVVLPLLDALGLLSGQGDSGSGTFLYGLQNSAGLQNLLLLRVLRLRRVLTDIGTFRRFAGALGFSRSENAVRPYQLQLARVVLSLFTLLSVASGFIYTAEHDVNPDIPDYFAALYFGLTTLTTVGFGDITPVTAQGKLVVSASIFVGVAVIPAQAAKFFEALVAFQRDQQILQQPRTTTTRSNDGTTTAERDGSQPTATTSSSYYDDRTTDGKGPRGTPIDEPVKEWKAPRRSDDHTPMDATATCPTCKATHHWSDAVFCWSCGSPLLPPPTPSSQAPEEDELTGN